MTTITCPHCGKTFQQPEPETISEADKARFFKCIKKQDNGCWIFPKGGPVYGRMCIQGKNMVAHRISWLIHNGAIPRGQLVLHDCPAGDNPRCVNPAHLWLGDYKDNSEDTVSKGRNKPMTGSRNGLSKMTEEAVLVIREGLDAGKFTIQQLADRYDITFQAIYHLATGRTWKHVGGPLLTKRDLRTLSVNEVVEIRKMAEQGTKGVDIATKFGIHPAVVSNIVLGKKRRDVSYGITSHVP